MQQPPATHFLLRSDARFTRPEQENDRSFVNGLRVAVPLSAALWIGILAAILF